MSSSSSALKKPDVWLSKQLSWLLRHAARQEGLFMRDDGFVRIADILGRSDMSKFLQSDVERVVEESDKQRYELREEKDGVLWIRASQGHSIKGLNLSLKRIDERNLSEYPIVQHGTYRLSWYAIQRQGLSKCNRNHIHFSKGKDAISGARNDCNVFIQIDLKKALEDGYEFFESTNGVILCPGNSNGILPAAYFKHVFDIEGNDLLVN